MRIPFQAQKLHSALIRAIIVSFILLWPLFVRATMLTENFNDCIVGDLADNCGWASNTAPYPQATTSESYEGARSGYFSSEMGNSYHSGNSLATGTLDFWVKSLNSGATGESTIITLRENETTTAVLLRFTCDGGNCGTWGTKAQYYNFGAGYVDFCYLPTTDWYKIGLEWDASIDKIRYRCGTEDWTAWTDYAVNTFDYINRFYLGGASQTGQFSAYIDDIDEIYEPPAGEYNPVLTPAWPVDCIFNATNTFSGTATGRLEIPPLTTGTWTELRAIFYDKNSGENTIASTSFSLTAGQKLDYSIPYSLATSTYDLWYIVWGYSSCTGIPYCQILNWADICGTGLGISATPTYAEIISPPAPFEQEDCSGYDLLERLVCEIKNFFAGVFLPNASSTLELQRNLDMVKQRAPYNYIVATKDFFASVNSTLTTSTPEISIMGATGTLNFGPLEATTTFAGSNQTISAMLRKFFQFFLILGFVAWAIGFLRKIFK